MEKKTAVIEYEIHGSGKGNSEYFGVPIEEFSEKIFNVVEGEASNSIPECLLKSLESGQLTGNDLIILACHGMVAVHRQACMTQLKKDLPEILQKMARELKEDES